MPRPKSIPDHSPVARKSHAYKPTDDEAIKLLEEYEFPDLQRLQDGIYEAFLHWERCKVRPPSKKSQRDQLTSLRDSCGQLVDVITKLGTNEVIRLADGNDSGFQLFRDELVGDLEKLKARAIIAMHELGDDREGRPRSPTWCFVLALADLWKAEKKTNPTCGYDDEIESYRGPFFKFAIECSGLTEDKIVEESNGGTVVNILKEWRKENN